MPCIPSARVITILYPTRTATMDTLYLYKALEKKKEETSLSYSKRSGPTKPLFMSALELLIESRLWGVHG